MTLAIDGRSVRSPADFFALFASDPDVPDYFGRNLDALDEVLAERLCPNEIVWDSVKVSSEAMGSQFVQLAEILREHCSEESTLGNEWRLKFR